MRWQYAERSFGCTTDSAGRKFMNQFIRDLSMGENVKAKPQCATKRSVVKWGVKSRDFLKALETKKAIILARQFRTSEACLFTRLCGVTGIQQDTKEYPNQRGT